MQNDGSQPAETRQRCSQIVFEEWMKRKCAEHPLIDCRFGLKLLSSTEEEGGVAASFIDQNKSDQVIRSKCITRIGCDRGASQVRKNAGMRMIGGPLYGSKTSQKIDHLNVLMYADLLSYSWFILGSKELPNLRPFGRFWHAFPPDGSFVIDQDEGDTFTNN